MPRAHKGSEADSSTNGRYEPMAVRSVEANVQVSSRDLDRGCVDSGPRCRVSSLSVLSLIIESEEDDPWDGSYYE